MTRAALWLTGIAFSLLLIFSCGTSSRLSNQDLAWMYRNDGGMHPQYSVYNPAPNLSRLYFKLSSSELLYTRENGEFTAQLLLLYVLRDDEDRRLVVDSGHVLLRDIGDFEKQIAGQADIKAPDGRRYLLEVSLRDLNKKAMVIHEMPLNKLPGARSYFTLSAPGSTLPLFRNTVDSGENFILRHDVRAGAPLYVRCFFRKTPPPPLPHAFVPPPAYGLQHDSLFRLDPQRDTLLRLNRQGVYFIQPDTAARQGFTVLCFPAGYPQVTNAEQLAPPLRYLTTGEEYGKLMRAADVKKAVDEFWLEKCGSEERAREVIRRFYKRVETTNRFFTTEREGWKTDRGMIFIVFGPPQHVYRSGKDETWYYGDGSSPMALNFIFTQNRNNPFSDNDYELNRNLNYKMPWNHALDEWRKGRVYAER